MQIKTTVRFYFTALRMAINQKWKVTTVDKDMEKLEHLCIDGINVKWCSHCEKQYGSSSKSKHRITIPSGHSETGRGQGTTFKRMT